MSYGPSRSDANESGLREFSFTGRSIIPGLTCGNPLESSQGGQLNHRDSVTQLYEYHMWMVAKSISHHFTTMVETITFVGIYR